MLYPSPTTLSRSFGLKLYKCNTEVRIEMGAGKVIIFSESV